MKHVHELTIHIMSNIILHITRNSIFFPNRKEFHLVYFFQFSNEMHFYSDLTWGSLAAFPLFVVVVAVSNAILYQKHHNSSYT